ncbi:GNAT family N-acetyltransferase [Geomicrobium sp. JSM 1781026]|uniref:GNAT family N-acetyltransferase n=1 Tax=unclassified Geomicrobium TaxID=2628951 RepID=UPI0005A66AA3|nr:GNAT family protein [Geomicrobium sp. JCM 19037]
MFQVEVEKNLHLHLIEMHHANDLYACVQRARGHLRRWLPWVDQVKSAYDYEPIITAWLQQFAEGRGFNAAIRHHGKFVGMVGLHDIDWGSKKTTLGYWLEKDAIGNGIMTKTVAKCTDILFTEYQLNRIQINCGVENYESQGIPKRLGFELEGIVRDGEWLYDHYHDLYQYSLLKSSWIEQQEQLKGTL